MKEIRFRMGVNGCAKAKKWLEDTSQIHLLDKEQSVDGFTLVALANSLWNKRKESTLHDKKGTGSE